MKHPYYFSFALFLSLSLAALPAFAQGNTEPIPGGCGVVGPNQIVNPEFDQGNVGFTSDYAYSAGYICQFGQYSVAPSVVYDPAVVCYNAPGFNIRTIWVASDRNFPGLGSFMLIDPSEATGADDDIWRQQIPVCPFTDYTFSVFAKNLYFTPAPNYSQVDPLFEMTINGIPINGYFVDGVFQSSSSYPLPRQLKNDSTEWIQISGTWSSGNTTTADMAIRNLISGAQGNDLAIDGVFLGICGKEVNVDIVGDLGQCPDLGLSPITLSASPATNSSQWLYYEWYKEDSLLVADTQPIPYIVQPTPTGSHFGNYRLKVYNDPLGISCGFASDAIRVFDNCITSFPVEWLDFTAAIEGSRVRLDWTTATERSNRGFEVQYAMPGSEQFFPLGFVKGAGDSEGTQEYRFVTGELSAGLYRFRLKQIDMDGAFDYSAVTEADLGLGRPYTVFLWPNPSSEEAMLRLELAERQRVQIDLYTSEGRYAGPVFEGILSPGLRHTWRLDGMEIAPGNYQIYIRGGRFTTAIPWSLVR